MKRFGVPALAAAALILIAGSFLARRLPAPPSEAARPDARSASAPAFRHGSPPPENAAPPPLAPGSLRDSIQAFMNRATSIESSALAEVEDWIERQGGGRGAGQAS